MPIPDLQFDVIVSFYSLEHIYTLPSFLNELERVLRPGGILIGAIPTEGGLAWGVGRFFTSRRYIMRNSSINPDKIICWEHPNFAETILSYMDQVFDCVKIRYWPFAIPLIDANLVVDFVYRRRNV